MAIDIQRLHNKTQEQAWTIASDLARDLAERFGVDYGIEDNHLHFERPGVSGTIEVNATIIRVTAQLNFLLGYLEPKIVDEINKYLDDHFD